MKILVVSDIHRDKKRLDAILNEHTDASLRISLGDSELSSRTLSDKDILAVKGNYPFDAGIGYDHVLTVSGRRWLLTHGHKYGVRNQLEELYAAMQDQTCEVALYGHTHRAAWTKRKGCLMINPGSISQSRDDKPESYLIVSGDAAQWVFSWYDARYHTLIDRIEHRVG
ncbi:MAG: YfcE family phosphodiesterase [Acholeplasmatales bacterium]|nr:MAG: YfcE family phosphodiesterase [Acholeplasmatales bacterium]